MAKFHFTENGPKICTANIKDCKYRTDSLGHVEGFTKANQIYELHMNDKYKNNLAGLRKETNTGDEPVSKITTLIEESLNSVEIPNSAGGSKYITLQDLKAPELAGNNCYAATIAISHSLSNNHIKHNVTEVVMDDNSVHWAIEYNGKVIDYSFSQFDEQEAFPLISDKKEWLNKINHKVSEKYGLKVSSHNTEKAY